MRGAGVGVTGVCERPLTGAGARAIIAALARFLAGNGIVLGRGDLLAVDVLARSGDQMLVVVTLRQRGTHDVLSYRMRVQRRHGHWQVSALGELQLSCLQKLCLAGKACGSSEWAIRAGQILVEGLASVPTQPSLEDR